MSLYLWVADGLHPTQEHRFCSSRKWKFDYAWPLKKIAVEIEGGLWVRGRHNRAAGYIKDMEKYNMAAKLGWRVFRFTPEQLVNREAQLFMKETILGG